MTCDCTPVPGLQIRSAGLVADGRMVVAAAVVDCSPTIVDIRRFPQVVSPLRRHHLSRNPVLHQRSPP